MLNLILNKVVGVENRIKGKVIAVLVKYTLKTTFKYYRRIIEVLTIQYILEIII